MSDEARKSADYYDGEAARLNALADTQYRAGSRGSGVRYRRQARAMTRQADRLREAASETSESD